MEELFDVKIESCRFPSTRNFPSGSRYQPTRSSTRSEEKDQGAQIDRGIRDFGDYEGAAMLLQEIQDVNGDLEFVSIRELVLLQVATEYLARNDL